MTVREKREALTDYCDRQFLCERCMFHDDKSWCEEYNAFTAPEDVVNAAYNKLVGVEEVEEELPTCPPPHDAINHPSHYTHGGMECIDEMIVVFGRETVKNFCLCNIWKYRKRALFKNGQEDLDKADWYMNKYKELSAYGTDNK